MEIQYISDEDLVDIIAWAIIDLDKMIPDWRHRLADCCLGCSDIPWGEPMRQLERLDNAEWLLHGKGYKRYISENE